MMARVVLVVAYESNPKMKELNKAKR